MQNKITINELIEVLRIRDSIYRGSAELSLSFRGNELAGEVGEACNVLKKLDRERLGLRGKRSTPDALADELADAIMCIGLIAMEFNFDLSARIITKFNEISDERTLPRWDECGDLCKTR